MSTDIYDALIEHCTDPQQAKKLRNRAVLEEWYSNRWNHGVGAAERKAAKIIEENKRKAEIKAAKEKAEAEKTRDEYERAIEAELKEARSCVIIDNKKNTPANKKLLKSAYKDDVKKFKEALASGADISVINKEGNSVAMLTLYTPENHEVINEILNDPKLCQKIDWKVTNEVGQDALSLAESGNPAIYDKIKAAVKEQNESETSKNKSRSGISYEFYKALATNSVSNKCKG